MLVSNLGQNRCKRLIGRVRRGSAFMSGVRFGSKADKIAYAEKVRSAATSGQKLKRAPGTRSERMT